MRDERPWRHVGLDPRRGLRKFAAVAVAGATLVAALVALGGWLFIKAREGRPLEKSVSAGGTRLTLGDSDREPLREDARRDERPDLYYHVTLTSAPVGERLTLGCDWVSPSGETARQNRYETRSITTEVWKTHCHQRFGLDSAAGRWTVRMTLDGRPLCSDSFTLR
jgi:hypothetical protein